MLDHARQFLSTVLPWPNDASAYCNIHWRSQTQTDKFIWDGRAATNIDETLKTLTWALKQPDIKDLYVCMSLQQTCEERLSKRGYSYKKAVRSSDAVVALKSLFLDIDVKEGAYETTKDALVALKGFIEAVNLPKPSAVVASGSGGFHVHWALTRELTKDEWQPLADALARATQTHGLMCDSQVTVDAARILRVPQTWNNKTEVPREVKLLSIGAPVEVDLVQQALEPFVQLRPKKEIIAENDELGAGMNKPIPTFIDDVAKGCAFIKHSLDNGGADNPQPLWFLTATVASFMEDGREALHRMSSGHDGYEAHKTDELFDRVTDTRSKRDVGWPKCAKFDTYGSKQCQGCPLLVQDKSPINFAMREVKPPVVAAGRLPTNYFRGKDDLIYKSIVTENGESVPMPVCMYPLGEAWLSNSPDYELHFVTKTDYGRETTMQLPCEVIFQKEGLAKYLGAKGFFIGDLQIKAMREFLMAWVQQLQKSKDSVVSSAPYGWVVVDGKVEGFAYNGRVWMSDGDRPAAPASPMLENVYKVKGTRDAWRDLSSIIIGSGRPALAALVAVGFAAPLMRFSGQQGAMLNAYSSASGVGKTTALRCGHAIWGEPKRGVSQLDDTELHAMKKIGQLRNLPLMWDEFQSESQTQKFAKIAFNITGGHEKGRLNSNAEFRSVGAWETMLASAANYSLIDHVAREFKSTTAGLYRCFEFEVPAAVKEEGTDGIVSRLVTALNDNCGHAGLEYAQFLGANVERVQADVAKMCDSVYSEFAMERDERFWNASITCVLLGAQYANELNLANFDLDELKDFLVTVLGNMRAHIKESPSDMTSELSMSSILGAYLNAMRARHTLETNKILRVQGRPPKGEIKILNDTSKLAELYVQIGKECGWVRFNSSQFSRWCAEHGYSRTQFVRKMQEDYGLEKTVGIIGGGTHMALTRDNVLEVNLFDAKLKEFVE